MRREDVAHLFQEYAVLPLDLRETPLVTFKCPLLTFLLGKLLLQTHFLIGTVGLAHLLAHVTLHVLYAP